MSILFFPDLDHNFVSNLSPGRPIEVGFELRVVFLYLYKRLRLPPVVQPSIIGGNYGICFLVSFNLELGFI
jgi:hypothetical protein